MVNGNMQHRNLIRKTTLGGHDINMVTEDVRNAPKGRICKGPAHNTVVSLSRGRTANDVVTLARQSHMRVSKGRAAPPASRQPSNQTAQLR